MKKIFIIFLNLTILCFIFIIFDYCLAKKDYMNSMKSRHEDMKKHIDNNNIKLELEPFCYTLKLRPFSSFWYEHLHNNDFESPRRITVSNKPYNSADGGNKPSVILFGCSFVESSFLQDNETFGYKLSQKTNRTVYNRGFSGFGISQMVWQTKENAFYENINSEPEYAIYVYILDHLRRIYESKYGHINVYLSYEPQINNNETYLIEKNPLSLQFNRFYTIRYIMKNFIFTKYLSEANNDKNFDLIKLYFKEARRELQKRYPNIKFIILKHPSGLKGISPNEIYSLGYSYTTPRWKELEDDGFIIYDLKDRLNIDITEDKYTFPDGHPNIKAWDIITDKLTKDLNM